MPNNAVRCRDRVIRAGVIGGLIMVPASLHATQSGTVVTGIGALMGLIIAIASLVLSFVALAMVLLMRRTQGATRDLEVKIKDLQRLVQDAEKRGQMDSETLRMDLRKAMERSISDLQKKIQASSDVRPPGAPASASMPQALKVEAVPPPSTPRQLPEPPTLVSSISVPDGGWTVSAFLALAGGKPVTVDFDPANRVFVRKDDGRFHLVPDPHRAGLSCLVPATDSFETGSQFQLHYSVAFECGAPDGGDIFVLRPADVREAANGYALVKKGEVRVG